MNFRSTLRVSLTLAAFVVLFAASAAATRADIIVSGNTTGCFNGSGCFSPNTTLMGNFLGFPTPAIDFQGQAFGTNVPTNGGTVTTTIAQFDLRTFASRNFSASGDTFSLRVTFTAPPGAGGPGTFTANLTGTITEFGGSESILINFNNTPQTFAYNGGTFTLEVLDLIVNEQSGFVGLQGRLGATATPEPATMLLLGTGLAGIGASLRKRRKAKRDAA